MGCTQSKIENEEAVTRCKDRKLFMKDAVSARNAFAAAHSSYAMALKNAGAALSDYANGETQHSHISDSAPGAAQSHYDNLPPPPPPLPNFSASALQRASSMPEFSVHKTDHRHSDPIIEEEDEEEIENESHGLKHRSSRSSGGGGGSRSGVSAREVEDDGLEPPPSPPRAPTQNAPPLSSLLDSNSATYDFFFPSMEKVTGPSLAEVDDERIYREEIERKMYDERFKKSEVDDEASSSVMMAEMAEKVAELPPQRPPVTKAMRKAKQGAPAEGKRTGKDAINVNLLQIFNELDDCFLKASESAHDVSKMLEANRLHYHSNFADNRGHIDHSARVMRVITWNRSFKGLPNADDGMDDFDSEMHETHATVLDKMLAWEKKLYDEVKTGELMKLEYQKKVNSLNKLKKRGASIDAIEKAKAAVSHLHTRYIVDMQSMDSTALEINRLRDEQLYPKLVALVDGMATMWETMRKHHENQSQIVRALRFLDISQSPKETTERHHERTIQLWAVAREWHSQFKKIMTHQKEYIKALNNWLKLNLIPIDSNLKEKVSITESSLSPPIQALLHAWHEHLEKLPDELAGTAIENFAAVMHSIVDYQVEEMKLRDKCEETKKEFNKKKRQFDDWYNKYMQRRTPPEPDEIDPERAQDKELIAERELAVETVKKKLEEDEEAYQKQCIQVREKSLTGLKARLPELFRAVPYFSLASSDMYRNLRSISISQMRA